MVPQTAESNYTSSFRSHEAAILGDLIRQRHSVEVVGIKRVGISNFLRFFLSQEAVQRKYLQEIKKHVFILIDLNDLSEQELLPFWTLTLKRIVDAAENSTLSDTQKKYIRSLFVTAVQTKDLFLTVDNIRSALLELCSIGTLPTLFFLRFDRLKNSVNETVFANFQGIREATDQRVAYVFTSFRPIDTLFPEGKVHQYLSGLTRMYLKPTQEDDMEIILTSMEGRFGKKIHLPLRQLLISLSGGHVQYLNLSLIALFKHTRETIPSQKELQTLLESDEQITLLTEEICESLLFEEKTALTLLTQKKPLPEELLSKITYLVDTGIIDVKLTKIFSPLFAASFKEKSAPSTPDVGIELSKKEHQLFLLLLEHEDVVCERDKIGDMVWPEYAEYGVSDWTIDRLIARLRIKLKQKNSIYAIVTVKTRGYKLVKVE